MASALVLTYIDKHPEEAAALIEGSPIPEVVALFESLSNEYRALLIPYLSIQYLHEIANMINEDIIFDLCKNHSSRTLFNVFSVLPPERQEVYLPQLPKRAQWYLKYARKHHDKYISILMSSDYLSLVETMTVEQVWKLLKTVKHKVAIIYTHDEESKQLKGQILMEDFYAANRATVLRNVAQVVKYTQTPFTPITNITQHNVWRHFDIIPIVDQEKRLLGIIQTKSIYEEILKEDHDASISLYDTLESLVSGFYSVIRSLYYSKSKD